MTDIKIPEELKELAAECIDKHVRVVQAILSGDYSSNTKAYQSVYLDSKPDSARESVCKVLAIPSVSRLYKELRELKLMENALTRAEAISILSDMARTDMGDLVVFSTVEVGEDDEGNPVHQSVWSFKDKTEIPKKALRSISELSATPQGLKIKQHDQKAAAKQVAEMLGWNAAKELSIKGELKAISGEMSLEEATRVYEENMRHD